MEEWKKILDSAIQDSGNPDKEPRDLGRNRPDNPKIVLLLEALRNVSKKELPVDALFPEGIPTDEQFFERLHRLRISLGFGQPEVEIVAILASAAVEKLSIEERSLILLGIADDSSENLSLRLEVFPQLVRDHSWPLELLFKVFLTVNDKKYQGNNGYDRAVQALAESRPEQAFDLVKKLITPQSSEKNLGLAQYLLGLLRLNDKEVIQQKINDFDSHLMGAAVVQHRILYTRSLIPTTWARGLTEAVMAHLQSVYLSGEPEEQIAAFIVAAHLTWCPANTEVIFQSSVEWLEATVSETLPEECKLAVIVLIHNASFWAKGGYLEANLPRLADLWLKIIPVDSTNLKYWDGVDLALHDLIEKNQPAFQTIFIRLAEIEGKKLIDAISDSAAQQNRMLLYSLRQRDNTGLVQDLLLSKHRRARRVGVFLYDELDTPIINKDRLDSEEEERLLLLLLELRLHNVSGLGLARLLVSLLSQTERCSSDFKDELLEDLVLLGKDLPGTVLEFFGSLSNCSATLKSALDQINEYFDGLKASDGCPALKMTIPGYAKASELFAKRFSRQVSAAVEKNSIFAQLTSKMILLYALNHSSYQHGVLTAPQALEQISHSQESPRIGVIAPESQAFRRLIAKNWIHRIEKGDR